MRVVMRPISSKIGSRLGGGNGERLRPGQRPISAVAIGLVALLMALALLSLFYPAYYMGASWAITIYRWRSKG